MRSHPQHRLDPDKVARVRQEVEEPRWREEDRLYRWRRHWLLEIHYNQLLEVLRGGGVWEHSGQHQKSEVHQQFREQQLPRPQEIEGYITIKHGCPQFLETVGTFRREPFHDRTPHKDKYLGFEVPRPV